eukprot:COSAG01_NODE_11567_length_1902_cov_1.484748_2_plen_89_part_00
MVFLCVDVHVVSAHALVATCGGKKSPSPPPGGRLCCLANLAGKEQRENDSRTLWRYFVSVLIQCPPSVVTCTCCADSTTFVGGEHVSK